MSGAEKFDEIMNYIKRMAGGEYVSFNNSVFLAEREVSDRNYALSYYMKENNCFPKGSKIKECVDFWYQCCAMEVNCESMAVICATLANGGTCPTTLDPFIKPSAVRDVLSLLHSCGFYEYSGQFAFKVSFLKLVQTCLKLFIFFSEIVQMILNLSKLVQSCPNLFKLAQFSLGFSVLGHMGSSGQ